MGPRNSTIEVGPLMVYSVNEDGTTEFLGTLGEIKSIEPEGSMSEEAEEFASVLTDCMNGTVSFTGKLTLKSRIKLRLWIFKAKIQRWLTFRKLIRMSRKNNEKYRERR